MSRLAPLALVLLLVGAVPATAQESPVNLALFSPVQITAEDASVSAFRFSLLYGVNQDVTGLDLSLVGRTRGDGLGVHRGIVHGQDRATGPDPVGGCAESRRGSQGGR